MCACGTVIVWATRRGASITVGDLQQIYQEMNKAKPDLVLKQICFEKYFKIKATKNKRKTICILIQMKAIYLFQILFVLL